MEVESDFGGRVGMDVTVCAEVMKIWSSDVLAAYEISLVSSSIEEGIILTTLPWATAMVPGRYKEALVECMLVIA